jgi:hypothetical protein
MSAEEFFRRMPPVAQQAVTRIRQEKAAGKRLRPSIALLDRSTFLTLGFRGELLDKVAYLVDENLAGRSEMCMQFADLLCRALTHLKLTARPAVGTASYYDAQGKQLFQWRHAWVRIGKEVIDGNVDCLAENPAVPGSVNVAPYWGPIVNTPSDRRLRETASQFDPDTDVENIWWPDLRAWVDQTFA